MLSSIHPLGERSRNNRWWLTAGAFMAGALVGGLTTGTVIGLGALILGSLMSPASRWALVGGVALVAVALELGRGGRPLPSWQRQVNEDWLGRYRGWVYGLGFGFQLGAGWLTYITTALVYLAAVSAAATGSPNAALLVGAVFGLTRGVLIMVAAPVRSPERLRALHLGLARAAGPARLVAGVTAAGTAGVAVGALW